MTKSSYEYENFLPGKLNHGYFYTQRNALTQGKLFLRRPTRSRRISAISSA